MGRVRADVFIEGKNYWALFDSGARNSYVVEDLVPLLISWELDRPEPVAIGGEVHRVTKECLLKCLVEGLPIRTHARVLKKIGTDERGKKIDVLIGALAMQEWGIIPIPADERLDMTNYPREFVEFVEVKYCKV